MHTMTKEELQSIVELANSVPEEYRQKCFELLLNHTLISTVKTIEKTQEETHVPKLLQDSPDQSFILPIDVKAFLSQYSVSEAALWKLFLIEGGQARPIYKLRTTEKSRAQIQHALLMSLEAALFTGEFRIDIEALRSRCKDQKCYDPANFSANIKSNSSLFKSVSTDQPLSLSPDGKSELADIIEELTKLNN